MHPRGWVESLANLYRLARDTLGKYVVIRRAVRVDDGNPDGLVVITNPYRKSSPFPTPVAYVSNGGIVLRGDDAKVSNPYNDRASRVADALMQAAHAANKTPGQLTRAEAREIPKMKGLSTSEGAFSRDLAAVRNDLFGGPRPNLHPVIQSAIRARSQTNQRDATRHPDRTESHRTPRSYQHDARRSHRHARRGIDNGIEKVYL